MTAFNVGDRVKVVSITGDGFERNFLNEEGTITKTDTTSIPVFVVFDSGFADWGRYEELAKVVSCATPETSTSVKDKLAAIDKLLAEIRIILG